MIFDDARAVADAVLFEGYALYPYRASSPKNQLRWQFGVLAPRAWSEGNGGDPWWQETECLVAPAAHPEGPVHLQGKLRFLRILRRDRPAGDAVPTWDEGQPREIDFAFDAARDAVTSFEMPVDLPGEVSRSGGDDVRRCAPLAAVVRVQATPLSAPHAVIKLHVRVENAAADAEPRSRDEALCTSMLGTHVLLGVSGGAFLSHMDPPDWAAAATAACRNVGTYPVLVGPQGRDDLLLSAPLILSDHPAVAPESPRDLFDSTEIDEILSLRIMTLTDQEKLEMRATDPRLAALLDAVERLGPEDMARLHGARRELRSLDAQPEPPGPEHVLIGGVPVRVGSRVRLQPGARRTDAQDIFARGMTATVQQVLRDVEDQDCLAVTIDDDPASEVMLWRRCFHYYYPDEVEPLEPPDPVDGASP